MTAHNDTLLNRLNRRIEAHHLAGTVTEDTMLHVDSRDEIERLNVCAACATAELERVFRWINSEFMGRHIRIVSDNVLKRDNLAREAAGK